MTPPAPCAPTVASAETISGKLARQFCMTSPQLQDTTGSSMSMSGPFAPFRQGCLNPSGSFASLAVLVEEDRDERKREWVVAVGSGAGTAPVSGLPDGVENGDRT
jgi:hypothetical protein